MIPSISRAPSERTLHHRTSCAEPRLPFPRLDQRGACVLGCLFVFTSTLLVLYVGGLIFHRSTPHVVVTSGRDLRVAEAPVPVYFTPGSTDRVVAVVRTGEAVWVRHFDETQWVAVFQEERSRGVLGFAPDSAFTRGALFPSVGQRERGWMERLHVRLLGGDAPRSR